MTLGGKMEQLLIKHGGFYPYPWVVCENAHAATCLPYPRLCDRLCQHQKKFRCLFLLGVGGRGSPGPSLSWLLTFLGAAHSGWLVSCWKKVKLLPVGLLSPGDPES